MRRMRQLVTQVSLEGPWAAPPATWPDPRARCRSRRVGAPAGCTLPDARLRACRLVVVPTRACPNCRRGELRPTTAHASVLPASRRPVRESRRLVGVPEEARPQRSRAHRGCLLKQAATARSGLNREACLDASARRKAGLPVAPTSPGNRFAPFGPKHPFGLPRPDQELHVPRAETSPRRAYCARYGPAGQRRSASTPACAAGR